MVTHWCFNGTMVNTDRYSSPVPWIGLYTATATLVCLVLILTDIYFGFRRKKLWFPCQFFSLNSITLTLLSISTKLPVDLTSAMPSSQDQLSKLTGTVFICLTIAFLMPSTGKTGEVECYSNMVALSIFIITVIINICVQIATGVIFSFIVEHAIILFCMLMLMVSLWLAAFMVNEDKKVWVDDAEHILKRGPTESLLERVKACYLYGYTDPQFTLCHVVLSGAVSLICVICVVVLVEVLIQTFTSMNVRFCAGVSAYRWSVWSVVGTQIVSIVVASFVIAYRWLLCADNLSNFKEVPESSIHNSPHFNVAYSFYVPQPLGFLRWVYMRLFAPFSDLLVFFVIYVSQTLIGLMKKISCISKCDHRSIEDFKHLLRKHDIQLPEWTLRKAVEDMKRLIQLTTKKRPRHLMNLLSTTELSRDSLTEQFTKEVSCLSILLLVEMANVSIPNSLTTSMMEKVIAEVFPMTYFISDQKRTHGVDSRVKSMTAKILFRSKARSGVMCPSMVEDVQSQSEIARALATISVFHRSFVVGAIRLEARNITEIFLRRRHLHASLNELCDDIIVLFVGMLNALLSQLPTAIIKHVDESPPEEYEKRVRLCLKFICQVELLEPYVRWSFPDGYNITGMTDAQAQNVDTQSNPTGSGVAPSVVPVAEDTDEIHVLQPDDNV